MKDDLIVGSGGGGKKGGGGAASNADNTLRSRARANFVEVISEGPIVGIVGGKKGVFFDQTPVEGPNGEENIAGVEFEERVGNPDDNHLGAFSVVETSVPVDVEVTQGTGPVVRSVIEQNADALRIIIRVNQLFRVNKKNGSLQTNDLDYSIDIRPSGGNWIEVVRNHLEKEKCTGPVQIAHTVRLNNTESKGNLSQGPWDIRVRSNRADSTSDEDVRSFAFEGYVVLVEGRFTYPHTALAAMSVNAEDLGGSIPARSYRVKGRVISVPSNYNPETRTYSGVWNGTFKQAWTNNPAWIYYDMVLNDRYGLGEFVDPALTDKWALYSLAQYSDQPIPSGFKDENGNDIMEPRFTFNGVLNTREEAIFVLQHLTATFRAMAYWAMNQIFVAADVPADPVQLVTPANVIDGDINYSSSSMRSRHSVALVRWNDPNDFYRPATEVVINEEMLQKFGWRETPIQLHGVTSRGLAHRHGSWALDVEQHEHEMVEYVAALDHIQCKPGDIIAIADPRRAEVRFGGRIVSHDRALNRVVLDHPFTPGVGETYQIMLTMPDGSIEMPTVTSFIDETTLAIGATPAQALDGSNFILFGSDIQPRRFRVLTVEEEGKNLFKVTGLSHDPNKYARIEQGVVFEEPPYRRPPQEVEIVSNLTASASSFIEEGRSGGIISLSWTPPINTPIRAFTVEMVSPGKPLHLVGTTDRSSFQIRDPELGEHVFLVRTVDRQGRSSKPVEVTLNYGGVITTLPALVESVWLTDAKTSNVFEGPSARISWANRFFESSDPTSEAAIVGTTESPLYKHNTVRIFDVPSNQLLREEIVVGNSYSYDIEDNRRDNLAHGRSFPSRNLRFEVSVTDIVERTSPNVPLTVINPVPAAITPQLSRFLTTVTVSWPTPTDGDFAGVRVWVSPNSGFNPLTTQPVYEGGGSSYSFTADSGETRYVRIAAYDRFGRDNLNISTQASIAVDDVRGELNKIFRDAGISAPNIVTALPASGQDGDLVYLTTDKQLYRWDTDAGEWKPTVDLQGTLDATAFADNVRPVELVDALPTSGNFQGRVVLNRTDGKIYRYHDGSWRSTVAAVDVTGQITSGQISDLAISTAKFANGIRPIEIVSSLPTSGNFAGRTVFLTTDGKLYRHTGSPSGSGGFTASVNSSDLQGAIQSAQIAGLEASKVTGQLSDTQIEALNAAKIVGQVVAAQIQDASLTTAKFANGIRPVEIVSALPASGNFQGRTVLLTTDNKLYRHTGSPSGAAGFTASVNSADITGTLQASQIAALEASKITGQLSNNQIAAVAAAKVTGQVVAEQIASNAITTAKFATGIRPIEIRDTLPNSNNFPGRMVFLTTDNKLYRHTGNTPGWTSFTAAVPADDISGQLAAAQIAALEASKITGQMSNEQIADLAAAKVTGQIVSAQIANNAVTNAKIAGMAASKVTGQLTDNQIADLSATKLSGQVVAEQIADAAITTAKFASGLRPIEIVSSLPSSGNFQGRTVLLTTDNKLYRHTGSPTGAGGFTAAVPSSDILGTIQAAQIAALEASKITGQMSNEQIADLAAAKVTGQIVASQIANGAITDAKIAGMAASKVTGQLSNNQIAAVEAAKITGQVVAEQIASSAITTSKFASNIRPIEIRDTLPNSNNFPGRMVFLTTDNKLYRHTGNTPGWTSFTAAVPADDITGTIQAAQIAALEASKITGQLTNTQIADLNATKLTGQIVASQIANGAITDAKIAGMAASKVTGQLTDNQIADLSAAKLSGQVVAEQIASSAITTSKFASNIRPIEIRDTLPNSNNFPGRMVFLTTDNKLYRHTGNTPGWTSFTAAVPADDITGTLQASQIAALEASKITGQLNDAQLSAINAAKVTGQIVGTQITDNAITTPKIATGAVTANEVAANAVTADKIAANAVTAAKIQANSVQAAKIAAGAVLADKIAANAVTADKIAANAVTADKVAANAITAGKISAGAVTAAEIAAGSITASRLVLGDTSNLIVDNNLQDPAYWGIEGVANANIWSQAGSRPYISLAGSSELVAESRPIPLNPNDVLFVGANAWRAGDSGEFLLVFAFYEEPDLSGNELVEVIYQGSGTSNTIFRSRELAVPNDMRFGVLRLIKTAGNFAARMAYPLVRVMMRGELIVDGAITAAKITANAITSAKIAAGAVTASEIAANAITAAKIQAGSVTTAKIAAGAVEAAQIAAGAVVADKIAANSVTGDKITANAITSAKIAAGAVTASEIAANSVTTVKIAAGAVETAQIAAGAVEAAKIAAGAITADKIAANAVTADKVAANAVTADKIAANAITAGKIAAGAITAAEIAAGSITASRLVLGDTSNLVVDNNLQDPAYWGIEGVANANIWSQAGSRPYISLSGPDEIIAESRPIPLNPNDILLVGANAWRAGGSGEFLLVFVFYEEPDLSGNALVEVIYEGTGTSNTIFRSRELAVPNDMRFGVLRIIKPADGPTTRLAYPLVRVMMRGELIVDGAITAQKIQSKAITANEIAAGAVTASEIAANAITAGKIAAGAVTTAKIQAGAVEAAQIAAGAVVAAKIAANSVTGDKITANAITSAKIAAGAVTANEIAANSVTTAKIAAGAVEAAKIAAGAVLADKIAANAVTADKIAANAVTADKIQAGAIIAGKIAAGAISTDELSANAITTAKIASGAVTASEIASNAVTAIKIQANAVTTAKIAAGAVTADEIAANAITAGKIQAGSVTTAKIAAGAVEATQIAADAVEAGKIAANAITADNIQANAVTTVKIAAGAVTADEIAANAITAVKIQAGAIETAKIAAGAVEAAQIASNAVTAGKIQANAVTADKIQANAVTAGKIAAGAVTAAEIAAGAITASKLLVSNFTNLILNSDLETNDGWDVTPGVVGIQAAPDNMSSGRAWRFEPSDSPHFARWNTDVQEGESYLLSSECRAFGASPRHFTVRYGVNWFDRDGVTISSTFSNRVTRTETTPEVVSQAFTAPAGAVRARFSLGRSNNANEIASGFIGSPRLVRMSDGEMIVDGAITADKIAVNAITAEKIAAGTITADEIASNAITTPKIEAGAVKTSQIDTGAVNAIKIATNAVTADKIQSNAVTADKIATNAITAGKIAAGAVNAREIAAGSITASRLVLGDTSNLIVDNNLQDPAYWGIEDNPSANIWSQTGSRPYISLGGSSELVAESRPIPLNPNDILLVGANAWSANGSGEFLLVFVFYEEPDLSGNALVEVIYEGTGTSNTIFRSRELAVPNDMRFGVLRIIKTAGNFAARMAYPLVRVMMRSELIVDGAITAQKIQSRAITASEIAGETITASEIAANAVTTPKIEARAITAAKIGFGEIEGNLIKTRTLTGELIQVDEIDAEHLKADSIQAGKIAAGAVNAREIAAGAITASRLVVGDTSNLIVDDMVRDPEYWIYNPNNDIQFAEPWQSASWRSGHINIQGAGQAAVESSSIIVEPESTLLMTAIVFRNSLSSPVGTFRLVAHFNTEEDFSGTSNFVTLYEGTSNQSVRRGGPVTVPAEARFVRMRVVKLNDGITFMRFAEPVIRVMARGELIVDGAISADKIAADAITAGKIAAGAVNAREIAAGAISASKLVVRNTDNLYPDYDMRDENFYTAWLGTGGFDIVSSGSSTVFGSHRLRILGIQNGTETVVSGWFSVEPNTDYRVEGVASAGTHSTAVHTEILIQFGSRHGDVITGTRTVSIDGEQTGWRNFVRWTNTTSQNNEFFARIRMVRRSEGSSLEGRFGGFKVLKRYAGELIVNGTITSAKIETGAINTALLGVGAVTAEKIDTTTFSASGLALFGGTLQSSNFSSGPNGSGWRIQNNGSAEFGTLALRQGAVSETVTNTSTPFIEGDMIGDANWVVINGHDPENFHDIIELPVFVTVSGRSVLLSISMNTDAPSGAVWGIGRFARRVRQPGGSWSAWTHVGFSYFDTGTLDDTIMISNARLGYFNWFCVDQRSASEERQYKAQMIRHWTANSSRRIRLCRISMGAQHVKR